MGLSESQIKASDFTNSCNGSFAHQFGDFVLGDCSAAKGPLHMIPLTRSDCCFASNNNFLSILMCIGDCIWHNVMPSHAELQNGEFQ